MPNAQLPVIFAAMTTLSYIIWNGNPEIFTLPIPFIDKELTLRWYGLSVCTWVFWSASKYCITSSKKKESPKKM
jgi:hypothetical protein